MSKALGHALEGYVKGMVQYLCDKESAGKAIQYEVRRKLPVALSMNCDIVVWRVSKTKEDVLSNVLVFHCLHKGSSEKKWKRSRQEYIESELLVRKLPDKAKDHFAEDFHTGMVIFLPFWKDELVADFLKNLTPCLYVPDVLTVPEEKTLCASVERLYDSLRKDTEAVAKAIRKKPGLIKGSTKLLAKLKQLVFGFKRKAFSKVVDQEWDRLAVAKKATIVPKAFSTRFCHGFNLLALFCPAERGILSKFHATGGAMDLSVLSKGECNVLRKGIFLGALKLRPEGKTGLFRIIFQAKVAVDDLDIAFVLDRLELTEIELILGNLMSYATDYTKPYAGFVSGLRMANCDDLLPLTRLFLTKLKLFLESKESVEDMVSLISDETEVRTPQALWSGAAEPVLGVWSTAIALAVAATGDRSHTKIFEFDRTTVPTEKEAKSLLRLLASLPSKERDSLIASTILWIGAWERGDLKYLAANSVPPIFNIEEPSSWLQWHYNIVGTHSVFSAVSEVCYRLVALKEFSGSEIAGFPKKRSEMVSKALVGSDSRAQLAMVGRKKERVVYFEGKCITKNNWGNKSKELFDRVGDFKRACAAASLSGEAVLVIDGDFSEAALLELASADAYDRIYSMDELLPRKK